jgi:hypothetical protein
LSSGFPEPPSRGYTICTEGRNATWTWGLRVPWQKIWENKIRMKFVGWSLKAILLFFRLEF